MPLISLRNIGKTYKTGDESVEALKDITLDIDAGEFVVIVGPSGSGKSTLLHLIGGLDSPTAGEIRVDGRLLDRMNDRQISRYRNHEIGFIFQDFHLQPHLDIVENVEIPLMFSGSRKRKEATIAKKARDLLVSIGLKDRLSHRPSEISGGQKQRVAIARALINKPKIILADEPTGNLDSVTGKKTITLLKRLHKENAVTMIVVTHDREIANYAERIVEIKDGRLIEQNKFDKFTG
jgi:putative ABC transport system ATP-binding protein